MIKPQGQDDGSAPSTFSLPDVIQGGLSTAGKVAGGVTGAVGAGLLATKGWAQNEETVGQ